jgi:hypothetical protein
MPTARYWRLAQCESYYLTGLEISEVALYSAGTRIDGSAILSCPTPLSSGTLENLRDSSFASTVRWDETYPLPPGFALVWDFGSDVSVDEVGIAGPSQSTFLHKFGLQYSSDGVVWSGNPVIRTKFIGSDAFFNYMPFSEESDPYFENVSLLLHMDGASGSTVFTDSSPSPKTVIANGNAQISTAQSKFGGGSLLLSQGSGTTGDFLSAAPGAEYVFGTGDFTLELWLKTTTSGEKILVDQYNGTLSWQWAVKGGRLSWYGQSGSYVLTSAASVNDNVWHHVAVTRASGVLRFFVDGAESGSAIDTTNYTKLVSLGIGAQFHTRNTGYDFPGHIDDLRITKGVARYTQNFSPPTAPFPNITGGFITDLTPLRQGRKSDAVAISEYPIRPTTSVVLTDKAPHIDVQDGGSGRIVGTVKEKATPANTPLRRKVWLLNYNDGRIVRETWSNELTGAYEFTDIDMNRTYTVVSLDHTGQYRAVIADNLSPEKM